MQLRSNKIMSHYLSDLGYDFLKTSHDLPIPLKGLLESGFVVDKGSVFLKDLCSVAPEMNDCEKSIYEDSENHFHPEDFTDEDIEDIDYLKMALECGKRLCKELHQEYSDRKFRIIISFDLGSKEGGEIQDYSSSTVKFYEVREECEKVMHVQDLDRFKEAILEIETN